MEPKIPRNNLFPTAEQIEKFVRENNANLIIRKTLQEWFGEVNPVPQGVVAVADGTNYVVTGNGRDKFWRLLDTPFVLYEGKPVRTIILNTTYNGSDTIISQYSVIFLDGSRQLDIGFGDIVLSDRFNTNEFRDNERTHRKIQVYAYGLDESIGEDFKEFSIDERLSDSYGNLEAQSTITGPQLNKGCYFSVDASANVSFISISAIPLTDADPWFGSATFTFYPY